MSRGYRQTLHEEMQYQERIVAAAIAPRLVRTPIIIKSSSFFVKRFPTEAPSLCRLLIYSSSRMIGPFDESSIVDFLFPFTRGNTESSISFTDDDEWSTVAFAEMTTFHHPSMAIYSGELVHEVAWIGRIYYHNPQHPYDFQVHVVLNNFN